MDLDHQVISTDPTLTLKEHLKTGWVGVDLTGGPRSSEKETK